MYLQWTVYREHNKYFNRSPSLVAQMVKNLTTMQETQVWEDTLKKEMAIHISILAWEIP